MCDKEKVKLPQLILAAVCELQEKNGVEACEISQFVAKKRGCKLSQIEEMIKTILCKAKNFGILCEAKGLYRIQEKYDDLPGQDDEDNDDESEDSEEEEDCPNPCDCIEYSKESLEDDEDEDRCCGLKKKPKCC